MRRASQTHQVPQVGFPQTDPVTKTKSVKLMPMGAAAFNIIPDIFALQITFMNPHIAIKMKIDSPKIADGT